MNPLDRLAVRLSLTRAEISVISILVIFLVLGEAVRNFRSVRDADTLVKHKEREQFSERETDSMLAIASGYANNLSAAGTPDTPEALTNSGEDIYAGEFEEEQPQKKKTARRSGKKVFSGTIAFNKASEKQLQQISGVGPVMAKRLVTFRASKGGRIERHEELLEVKGIGKKKLEILKKHLTLE